MKPVWIPLAERSAEELFANAHQLRRMAMTARTGEVLTALMKLADRYDALAATRSAQVNA